MSSFGVYAGFYPEGVTAFESWLDGSTSFIALHTGKANWTDWLNSINTELKYFAPLTSTHQLDWTIPMFVDGGTLPAAASGAYNSYYVQAAKALVAGLPNESTIYVRVGEEFNLAGFPWTATNDPQDYVKAYQDFVTAFRSVSSKFKFEWNVNEANTGMNPASAYPGDNYVDIIGMDFYYKAAYDGSDPLKAWNNKVNDTYGLQWLENFATAHGKPTAYSEWGVDSNTAGPYVQKAFQWFASHNVVYDNYWDANQGGFNGQIDNGQYAAAASAFKAAVLTQTVTLASNLTSYVDTGIYSDTLIGNSLNDVLTANNAGDVLKAGSGIDTLIGGAGNDTFYVNNTADQVVEQANKGTDTIFTSVSYTLPANVEDLLGTGSNHLTLTGNDLNDQITGNSGGDILTGGAGNDLITGGSGNDKIIGGTGADTLTGGGGSDTFVFSTPSDSTTSAWDVITDLTNSNTIDLSGLEAYVPGHLKLHQVSTWDKHPGEIMMLLSGGNTFLYVDLNGDAHSDMSIKLSGNHMDFTNFIL